MLMLFFSEKMKKFDDADKMYHLGVQNFAEPVDELHKSYKQFLRCIEQHKNKRIQVILFVDAAVGKSDAEDACHHGLLDPTIKMKEAMNAIDSMFREPIEPVHSCRRSTRARPRSDQNPNKQLELQTGTDTCNPQQQAFKIFTDEDDDGDEVVGVDGMTDDFKQNGVFVFPNPIDSPDGCSHMEAVCSSRVKFGEDTAVCRFVGSAILDEPVVENVYHHGLVEPTINLKEAMDDINMFGKPIDFVRTRRPKDKAPERKNDGYAFSILGDDVLEPQQKQPQQKPSWKFDQHDFLSKLNAQRKPWLR
ncbi:hypothetical protein RJ641_035877 [Dillenia turbinata]|uniref:Uncharacterized protein n=1 Tax=Dillenia turbinata TaxID=194707 RepID=A0AAN8VS72_9MAGN